MPAGGDEPVEVSLEEFKTAWPVAADAFAPHVAIAYAGAVDQPDYA